MLEEVFAETALSRLLYFSSLGYIIATAPIPKKFETISFKMVESRNNRIPYIGAL